ncbi:MAG: trehalose-phosphatase [Candidatus Omnitrophota bacterium]
MKYLFSHWQYLRKRFAGKYIMLFLDYDGTLTPIVSTPDKATMPEENKRLLRKLLATKICKIAVISGRSLRDVKGKVALENIIYSGNHGLQIEGPKIKFQAPLSKKYRAALKQIKLDLQNEISGIKGAFVEDKGPTLSVHYRLVNKRDLPRVKTAFRKTVIVRRVKDEIKVKEGKKVFEIRPPADWNKGNAVAYLLARQKFISKGAAVSPVYIGDDVTDEDAFRALGGKGLTIFVGKPKKSSAQYYLKNAKEVSKFLKELLMFEEKNRICRN